jgi:hypothetical protein
VIALGHFAVFAWGVLGVVLFRYYPGHRLVAGMFVAGVLFLPEFSSAEFIEGVPRPLTVAGIMLTKTSATALGLLVGSLLFDRGRWLAARPRWFDWPVLAWCVGPVVSSVSNSYFYDDPVSEYAPEPTAFLGKAASALVTSDLYDGVVRSVEVVLTWGVPYCLGRLWLVAGAVVYAPLCVLEMFLSPQLHRWVYGFHQHEFLQSIRFDGYRPMVFLEHGLAVGFWMMAGAVAAVWLWVVGPMRVIPLPGRRVSGLWVVVPLTLTAVACKSTGALVLGILGLAVLAGSRAVRWPVPVLMLLAVAPLYALVRTEGSWDADEVVNVTHDVVGEDRAQSLEFRLRNEDLLVVKALERPLVGWGGWGRSRLYDEFGRPITIADGLWILTLGERGLLGLITLGFVLLLPTARLIARQGARPWTDPGSATTAVAAVILGLYSIDCLFNAMLNPVFILLGAGLIALPPNRAAPPAPEPAQGVNAWRISPPRGQTRVTMPRAHSRVISRPGNPLPGRKKAARLDERLDGRGRDRSRSRPPGDREQPGEPP